MGGFFMNQIFILSTLDYIERFSQVIRFCSTRRSHAPYSTEILQRWWAIYAQDNWEPFITNGIKSHDFSYGLPSNEYQERKKKDVYALSFQDSAWLGNYRNMERLGYQERSKIFGKESCSHALPWLEWLHVYVVIHLVRFNFIYIAHDITYNSMSSILNCIIRKTNKNWIRL